MPSIADRLLLTRGDLLTFQKDTVDLILEMQKDGWFGQRNSQGHVKMLAPDGETHVMATSNKNAATYVRQGWNQYKKRSGEKEVNVVSEKKPQKWPCARPSCPKVYATEQQLNTHIAVDHEKMVVCEYANCFEVRQDKRKLSIHMTHAHGYESPRKAQRKKQEAARAKKVEGEKLTPEIIEELRGEPVDLEKEPLANGYVPGSSKLIDDHIHRHAEKTLTTESNGPLPNWVVDADGAVHDVVSVKGEDVKVDRTKLIMDSVDVHHLIRDENRVSLKGSITAFDPPLLFDSEIPTDKIEPVDFIDERDSWVMDISDLRNRRVGNIERLLKAAGLGMEIRVWKK